MKKTSTVFLSPEGDWTKLGDASVLRLNELSPLILYIEYIFPHFTLLSDKERMTHLKHIRDTDNLFNTAWYNNRKEVDSEEKRCAAKFIAALKQLPCLLRDGEPKPVSNFCDPSEPIFAVFLTDDNFPPDHVTDTKWLSFFRKIGLRTTATKEEFVTFCSRIADGNQRNILDSSKILMEYLFKNVNWHNEAEFLTIVSEIPFVCAETLKDLHWIVPVANLSLIHI